MSYYYVTHPNIDFSATVKAPSTDKARTTFLDYLERTGRANRKYRQNIRRNTVAERIEFPEEVDTDVTLNYDYTGSNGDSEETIQVGYVPETSEVESPDEEGYEPMESTFESEPQSEPLPVEQVEKEYDIKETPIGKMSLGSV